MNVFPLRVKATGVEITGTKETVPGRAIIIGVRAPTLDQANWLGSNIEWEGGTEIFWDEQKTVMQDGGPIYLDDNGKEYAWTEVEAYDPDLEDE